MESDRLPNGQWAPGHKRVKGSGRPRGVGNKLPMKVYADVLEQIENRNFNIIEQAKNSTVTNAAIQRSSAACCLGLRQLHIRKS